MKTKLTTPLRAFQVAALPWPETSEEIRRALSPRIVEEILHIHDKKWDNPTFRRRLHYLVVGPLGDIMPKKGHAVPLRERPEDLATLLWCLGVPGPCDDDGRLNTVAWTAMVAQAAEGGPRR